MPLLSFGAKPSPSTSSSTTASSAIDENNKFQKQKRPSISTFASQSTSSHVPLITNDVEEKEEKKMFEDMLSARRALDLFLNSRIQEAEAILEPQLCKTSMYYALGKSVLLTLKSMMTFEQADFQVAIEALRHTVQLSTNIMRKAHGALWFLEGWVKNGLTVERLQKMRPLYRHAVCISIYF